MRLKASVLSFLLSFLLLTSASEAQVITVGGGGGTSVSGGGTSITGGACTNQVFSAINIAGVPTCHTVTGTDTDTTIAKTGVDVNTSNQVIASHLTVPLPAAQGGLGIAATPGTAGNVPKSDGTNWTVSTPVTGGTCTNQVASAISTLGVPTCHTVTATDVDTTVALKNNQTFTGTHTLPATTATSINKVTITAPATGSTLTIQDGQTINSGAVGGTIAYVDQTNTFTGRQDATGAASTAPIKSGTSLPGTCVSGKDIFYKTDATSGQNLYFCNGTNTWTQQLNSGGGAPTTASYITQVAEAGLSNEFALGSLATGLVKVTTTTGALSTAADTDLPSTITENSLVTGTTIALYGQTHGVACTCTIVLPTAVGVPGNTIAFRIISGVVTLDGNGSETLGGGYGTPRLTRIMVAGESALLRSDGSNWIKIAGQPIALHTMLTRTTNQGSLTTGSWQQVVMNSQYNGYAGMYDAGNGWVPIIRPGDYALAGGYNISGVNAGAIAYVSIGVNANSHIFATSNIPNTTGGVTALAMNHAIQLTAAAGDNIRLGYFVTAVTSGLIDTATNLAQPFLSVTEISPW